MSGMPPAGPEFLVVCLCAQWCGTCRDYRPGFEGLKKSFTDADFIWVDVEDDAHWVGEFDVDDFPTLLIQRGAWVLFYGTMLPHLTHLKRTLGMFREQTRTESRDYAYATPERRAWQEQYDFRRLLAAHPGLRCSGDA